MPARPASFRCVPLILLMAVVGIASHAEPAQLSNRILIDGLGKGTVPLSGPWKFHAGDDPSWSSPSFDDSDWEPLSADRPWGLQGHARYTGFAWYRLRLTVRPAPGIRSQFSLLVPRINDVYEVYWNGEMAGHNGKMPPYPIWYFSQPPQIFEIGAAQGGVLAFRVWKTPLMSDDTGDLGGFADAPLLGGPAAIVAAKEAIDYQWLHGRQFLFGEHLIYGLIALLSFLVWWRNRKQWLLLWMLGYALAPVLVLLLLGAHIRWPYSIAMGLSQPANSIHDVSLWLLLLWLLHLNEDRRLLRLVKVLALAALVITTFDGLILAITWRSEWLAGAQAADAVIAGLNTLLQMLPLVLVSVAVYRRKQLGFASWMVAFFAFLDEMIVVVHGALRQGQRFTGWKIGEQLAAPLFTANGNPISPGIIAGALLLISIVCAVYIQYREDQRRQIELAREFSNARELQRMLIPETQHATPGFALTSSYCPALQVGGDFFQLIPVDRGSGAALLVLGDVSGHGLKAALSVSYVVGIMRVLAESYTQPALLLTEMNQRLCGRMQSGFVTCIAIRIDRTGSCALASAGHPPPFLNGSELGISGSLPLGIDASVRYQQNTIQLNGGDHLALYTDGLLEARDKTGDLYGFGRLQQLFAGNPSAAEAAEAAIEFGQDDDVTVVTLTCMRTAETSLDEADQPVASARVL